MNELISLVDQSLALDEYINCLLFESDSLKGRVNNEALVSKSTHLRVKVKQRTGDWYQAKLGVWSLLFSKNECPPLRTLERKFLIPRNDFPWLVGIDTRVSPMAAVVDLSHILNHPKLVNQENIRLLPFDSGHFLLMLAEAELSCVEINTSSFLWSGNKCKRPWLRAVDPASQTIIIDLLGLAKMLKKQLKQRKP